MSYLQSFNRIVIKVGSSLLIDSKTNQLNVSWLKTLCDDIASLQERDKEVILVTSGSVALGRCLLDLTKSELTQTQKQAAAACGQPMLMQTYHDLFSAHQCKVAQILLNLSDTKTDESKKQVRAMLTHLLDLNTLPIINENDATADKARRYSNNDELAAEIGCMMKADCVILLSDIRGLYTADPKTNADALLIRKVSTITPFITHMAGDSTSPFGKGGMRTKIVAAELCLANNCSMIIAYGEENPLQAIMNRDDHTLFSRNDKGRRFAYHNTYSA